ncbi:uncharacterized protein BT62DRAFT_908111 [Guyanagaster necrorhizus]|uniref:NFX1-type zinc finger-containing protein 1 n=1 Tax=Guyanagaster necrorhizus TaxID=856835 RepID=A0A9P8AMQ6_9AGAR|nr:uncharacterized protein BT62DRAFT_908111 [Guyanagaster necrorhizus MCA 3950]KAG7441498.1 hypothetical protein BT62DRAFT_908111 [Guyanagaster necrorhizus MCA 3950]
MSNRRDRQICRSFNSSRGCRFQNCKFLHERTGSPTPSASSTPLHSPRSSSRPEGITAGRGNCEFFWTSGECRRGFDCTYRHVRQPQIVEAPPMATCSETDTLDFLTTEGLADINNMSLHSLHAMSPTEAHNMLKQFNSPDFQFMSPDRVVQFVQILASVDRRNSQWDTIRAQSFLEMIVNLKHHVLARIREVLQYSPVSCRAGTGFTTLSFQIGYFPLLQFFGSDLILKTNLHHNIHALYSALDSGLDHMLDIVSSCMEQMIQNRSWKDPTPALPASRQSSLSGVVVFGTIATLLTQYFQRFKHAINNHPDIAVFVGNLVRWHDEWARLIMTASFDDSIDPTVQRLTLEQIKESISRLDAIVQRERANAQSRRRPAQPQGLREEHRYEALQARLIQTYDAPGALRLLGPRHSNDHCDIADIQIVPTHDEMISAAVPYIPVNLPDAPHHLAPNSMERHLDIQFRLLREELVAPIRASISTIQLDYDAMQAQASRRDAPPVQLQNLLKAKGGIYRTSGYDSTMFHIYTNVEYAPLQVERRGFTVGLVVDAPPSEHARHSDPKVRKEFWEHSGSRRLSAGSIVVLVIATFGRLSVYAGSVSSSTDDIIESSKAHESRITIRVNFFDPHVELGALRQEKITIDMNRFAFLVDNNIMFESIRPFLEKLRSVEPTSMPFSGYICGVDLGGVTVAPPKYSQNPSFRYNLECLSKDRIRVSHPLNTMDPLSIRRARLQLKTSSNLDPSQCDAVVDALTREVSLIQGPPGTGKSFTGKELLRVLFANKVKPIVMIAFTNHALDHMLLSLLDADITKNLVRLGSRSSDERINEYTLDKLERMTDRRPSPLDQIVGKERFAMGQLEDEMRTILQHIQTPSHTWETVSEYPQENFPDHYISFSEPPFWIDKLAEDLRQNIEAEGEWTTVHKNKKKRDIDIPNTIYSFWKTGQDISFLQPPQLPQNIAQSARGKKQKSAGGKKQKQETLVAEFLQLQQEYSMRMNDFFIPLGFPEGELPSIPTTSRRIDRLMVADAIWRMSVEERQILSEFWEQEMRTFAYSKHRQDYEERRKEYEAACKRFNDAKDESRRQLLSRVDLIGCTTNGAAKLTSLLTTVAPKVLMVEEAGQVLEAHILSSLVPSVQHLICIGDPKQLRPTLANFSLSMDSERGRELYKFDRSLMERLADGGFPMSQINVQRRMRPTISHNIRKILYSNLEDHDIVTKYPPIQGMEKDLFFFTHTNREKAADEGSVSKVNTFEVKMIVDLVMYFLKQEAYSSPGDIAVLCAYLGQLRELKSTLNSLKVAVSVDERDQDQLAREGMDDEGYVEQVTVSKHVRLGTVDIFQGEEAKIVVVSLVRNSGSFDSDTSIGFLKSVNRINVALSRAQHGLYILGNASNLRQNPTWKTIIDEMEQRDQIGFGFSVICPRHPNQRNIITAPGQLSVVAPEGGCCLPCDYRMDCGHNCPSMCHLDLDKHRSMQCYMPCLRTPCPRMHPCHKRCSDKCGPCEFPLSNVELPCGHKASISCYQAEDLSSVFCHEEVIKWLPLCGHEATVYCSDDLKEHKCLNACGGTMSCCGKTCKSSCGDCTKLNLPVTQAGIERVFSLRIIRILHKSHQCERLLFCQHKCGLDCSQDHECNTSCAQACRQRCSHHKCPKPCAQDCAPCAEPCDWICPHLSCPVLCGSICARLPCDEPCRTVLQCGHICPSVCGEPCLQQKCIECLSDEDKMDIVDFVMQRTLAEIPVGSEDISDKLITLDCGHIFTVETLDGHCHMTDYYEVDGMGSYTGMKAPPTEFQLPPSCPTCRSHITARRYGRILKRANLDILEQNVASVMSQRLAEVVPSVETFRNGLAELEARAKELKAAPKSDCQPADVFEHLVETRKGLMMKTDEVLDPGAFTAGSMVTRHGLSESEAKSWMAIVVDFLRIYKKVANITKTRSAHVRAYESALATLYRLELAHLAAEPPEEIHQVPPEHIAMRNVDQKIGQPPHKADRRYHLEAFILSVELRLMLGSIARSRFEALPMTSNEPEAPHHRNVWYSFTLFIYQSCIIDCQKAITISHATSSSRLAARSATLMLCSDFEQFRFSMLEKRRQVFKDGASADARDSLIEKVQADKKRLKRCLRELELSYFASRPSSDSSQVTEDRRWFHGNCRAKIERCFTEYRKLEDHIMNDAVYQPMSLQEKQDIVQALGFSHRGHFYNCINGHTFVITECGGAMEASQCPECRAPIGGRNHRLNSSNTRAREYEDISRQRGGKESPWAWAADA